MAADPTNSMYKRNYMEAQQHMENDDFEAAAETATYNLTDPTLPPYYKILNVILLVSASTDWEAVEPYRRAGESTWAEAYEDAQRKEDEEAIEVLDDLRHSLDELAKEKAQFDEEMEEYENGSSDADDEMDLEPPLTARDIVKTEAWAEQRTEGEMEDTAGLEDPFDDGSTAAKGKEKALVYRIPEVRKPADVAGSPSKGPGPAKSDLPQTLRNLERTKQNRVKTFKKGTAGARNMRQFTVGDRSQKEAEKKSSILDDDFFISKK